MSRHAPCVCVALLMAAGGANASAHHNIGMIEIGNPVWVRGTVVRYEARDPHVLLFVEQRRADGQLRVLKVEGPILARLGRMNLAPDLLKPGDVIELCGFPFRKDVVARHRAKQRAKPGGGEALPSLHAQLLVLPDGRWQPWGAYGKLDNCIREGDDAATWARFIEAEPMAREYWCKGLATTSVPSVRPDGFAEDVNSRLASPCP